MLYRPAVPGQVGQYAPPDPNGINPGQPARTFAVFTTPTGPAVAAADRGGNTVTLYRLVNGQWKAFGTLTTGHLADRILAADLTGTKFDDMVIANQLDNTVTIYFQNPDGTFVPVPLTLPVGITPSSLSLLPGGLNGPDILVTGGGSGDVTILHNDPGHTFASQSHYRAGVQYYQVTGSGAQTQLQSLNLTAGVVAGHFHGANAPLDLVALNRGGDSFSLLNGTGTGFLDPTPAFTFRTGVSPSAVVVGDFNHDGTDDLAVLQPGLNQVWVYLGKGDGTFAAPLKINVITNPTGLTVVDANHDGKPDLLIGNAQGDTLLLLGNGDGTFSPPKLSTVSFTVGNFSGTGQPDVVTFNQATGTVASYDRSAGSTTFTQGTLTQSGYQAPIAGQTVVLTDANGVSTTYVVGLNSGANQVLLYKLNADGTWSSQTFTVGNDPVSVTVANFGTSGVPSLVVANAGSDDVSILFGSGTTGNWTLSAGPRYSVGASPLSTQIRTINGNQDLVITNSDGSVIALPGVNNTGFFRSGNPISLGTGKPIQSTSPPPAASSGTGGVVIPPAQSTVIHTDNTVGQLVFNQGSGGGAPSVSETTLFTPTAGDKVTTAELTTLGSAAILLVGVDTPTGGEVLVFRADATGAFTQSIGVFQVANPTSLELVQNHGADEIYVAEADESEPIVLELESAPTPPTPPTPVQPPGAPPEAPPPTERAGGTPEVPLPLTQPPVSIVQLQPLLAPPGESADPLALAALLPRTGEAIAIDLSSAAPSAVGGESLALARANTGDSIAQRSGTTDDDVNQSRFQPTDLPLPGFSFVADLTQDGRQVVMFVQDVPALAGTAIAALPGGASGSVAAALAPVVHTAESAARSILDAVRSVVHVPTGAEAPATEPTAVAQQGSPVHAENECDQAWAADTGVETAFGFDGVAGVTDELVAVVAGDAEPDQAAGWAWVERSAGCTAGTLALLACWRLTAETDRTTERRSRRLVGCGR